MPTYCIIGLEKVSFKDRDDKLVEGVRVFMTYDKKKVDGSACDSVFLNTQLAEGLQVGMVVNLLYNKYGKVVQIDLVS